MLYTTSDKALEQDISVIYTHLITECITCVTDEEKNEGCKQTIYCHCNKHQDGWSFI